ncbi:hypothetical protein Scep_019817 [Stephania cephalantha]|uniref:Uncharacterized protein n=1 Tax=Stephania cephalantha TaxID=152367 RepID=A0AAP0NMI7_9MAGN
MILIFIVSYHFCDILLYLDFSGAVLRPDFIFGKGKLMALRFPLIMEENYWRDLSKLLRTSPNH